MEFDSFKIQVLSLLSDGCSLQEVAEAIDSVAKGYDICKKEESTVILEPLSMFLAAKNVEDKSKQTLKLYRSVLSNFLKSVSKPVGQITTADIRTYLSSCKQNGHKNSTVGNTRRIMNSFFEWCVLEGIVQPILSGESLPLSRRNLRDTPCTELSWNICATPVIISETKRWLTSCTLPALVCQNCVMSK